MTPEYTVIDCKTDLIEGPFESFEQARECAEDFKQWEIINRDGDLVDWSPKKRKGRRRRTCVLYWLFDKTCTDPWKHGYIGISKRRAQRLWRHKRGGQWPKGFKHIILFIGSDDACTTLENIMRPTPRIGWNRAAGGCTSIRFAGVPKPLAQRLLMSKAATLRFTDPAERKLMRDLNIGIHNHHGENNPNFGKVMSKAAKQKMRDKIISRGGVAGEHNGMFGRTHTVKTRRAISEKVTELARARAAARRAAKQEQESAR
jgi:NUMOD3 motif